MNKNIMGIGQGSWREKKDTWKMLPGESRGVIVESKKTERSWARKQREKKEMWEMLPGESSGHPNLTSSRCSEGDNSNLELQIEN